MKAQDKKDLIREQAEQPLTKLQLNRQRYYARHKERIRLQQTEYYRRNPEYLKAKVTAARKSPTGRATQLLKAAKLRALEKGLPFTLTKEDISSALLTGRCQVTGIKFSFEAYSPFAPSIDRKIPEQGYTKENSVVVVKAYNYAKGCGTHDDVVTLAKAVLDVANTK